MKQVALVLLTALLTMTISGHAQSSSEFSNEVDSVRDVDAVICKLSNQFCNLEALSTNTPLSREQANKAMALVIERKEIYLQAMDYLWPKLRTERDGARYRDLYAAYEKLTIGHGKLQNLNLMLIVFLVDLP